jgi:serine/threonine protein kinase
MAKRLPSTVYLANGRTEVVTLAFTMCGTPEFMGPEFVLSTGYDKNIDLWALGCMLVEMHTARSPFEYGDLKRTFKEVCLIGMGKHKYRAPIELQQEEMKSARRFIEGLICPVSMRLGMKDTLDVTRHEYFGRIDFQAIEDRSIIPPYVPSFQGSNDVSYFHDDDWSSENEEDGTSGSFEDDESWCIDF